MHKLLLTTVALAALASPAQATLMIEVFDNGALIDNISGVTTGAASLTANDANFSNITVNAQGSPILPHADLSSVTLDATTGAFTTDEIQFAVAFTAADQSFGGSAQLTTDVVPGPVVGAGLPGLIVGLGLMGLIGFRKRNATRWSEAALSP